MALSKARNQCQKVGSTDLTTKVHIEILQGSSHICVVRSLEVLKKVGSTSNSITYPRSRTAPTLVFFGTGSSCGLACTPLMRNLLKTVSGNLQDGNMSVHLPLSPSLSELADTSTPTDRGLPLGYGLFHRWERLHHIKVWRLLRNDCIIWHWGVQTADAVSRPRRSNLGHTTEGRRRCCKPRSRRIYVLPPSDVIQL